VQALKSVSSLRQRLMVVFSSFGTKTFILKPDIKSRGVCSSMSCEYCGKPIKDHEEFVLVGEYPTRGQMWKWSEASYYVKPESYGKTYHKECFLAMLDKEKPKP
jgi:hypothetical protein